MVRKSRQHTSEEFGHTGLGSAAAMGDRALGAAPGVIVDGLVEAESGVTPGPGPTGRTIVVAFVVLMVVAVAIIAVFTVLSAPTALPVGPHRGVWVGSASINPREADLKFELMPDAIGDEAIPVWAARPGDRAVFVIDGRVVTGGELIDFLQGGMMRADVTATEDGVISRIEIVTPDDTSE